jgi:hypothetical protein
MPAPASTLAAVPRVASDHDVHRAAPVDQPSRDRRGRRPHHGPVHPVRPGADRAAQSGRAERQPPREPVGQFRAVPAVQQGAQLRLVALVGVVVEPRLNRRPQLRADCHKA